MIEYNITFRKLKNEKVEFQKIYTWCQNKYVYEWFEQRKLTIKEIEEKYKNKLKEKKQDLYIIMCNDIDIGLVQIYPFNNDVNIDTLKQYNNIYEYDLFIGEEQYLNKGIGKQIIKKINQKIYNEYPSDAIILRPFKRNIRAVKCYEKSNFKMIYEYKDTDTLGNIEEIIIMLNKLDRWKFGTKPNELIKLVLEGKKTATTSLYKNDKSKEEGGISILTNSNNQYICKIKTKKEIITEFKNITWDLAKLEGENNTLEEWKTTHKKYFQTINKNFNDNTKVAFEIFEVIDK